MVSVIIPTIKEREVMRYELMCSLPDEYETILVDDENLSLAAKRNKGAALSTGDYLLFIDDDNYIQSGAIDKLLAYIKFEKVGIVGMMACYHNDHKKIADGGSKRGYLSGFMKGINTNKSIYEISNLLYEVDEVANAFMISRELFMRLGGFDAERFPTELDEADLCFRAKRYGYKIMVCPMALCYHHSVTYSRIPDFRRPKNAYFMGRNKILFQKKLLDTDWFDVYLMFFMPIMVMGYIVCLLYRGKPKMLYHFLKGVLDALRNRLENSYQ